MRLTKQGRLDRIAAMLEELRLATRRDACAALIDLREDDAVVVLAEALRGPEDYEI